MLPTIDFERLRTFYIATKKGKFSIVAQELGMDSSAVTRQIQGLERDLECILFERNGFRGLRLTEQGEILQNIAHQLFTHVAEIKPALAQVENGLKGHLTICVHAGYSLHFVAYCIDEFVKQYPNIALEIITAPGFMDVTIREADIVIGPNIENKDDLIEKEIFTYNLKLYASKEYIQEHGMPKDVADLKNHRFVSASSTSVKFFSKINWYLDLLQEEPLHPYFISNSGMIIEKSIRRGVGIGSMSPQFIDKDEPTLVEVLPHITGPKLTSFMAYGKHFEKSKKVEVLYNFLLEKAALLPRIS
jgi:DNA-binding transcriptional LysR family regulator